MYVEIPAEIVADGFLEDVGHMAAHESDMVFESVPADMLHQLLEIVDPGHGYASVHVVRVIGDVALSGVGLDHAARVVGGYAEEGEVTGSDLGEHGSEGVHLAEGTAEDAERSELHRSLGEALREVSAVGAYAHVAVLGEVVVPVSESGRSSGSWPNLSRKA